MTEMLNRLVGYAFGLITMYIIMKVVGRSEQMRRRTPSEIKAYGDGYAEAYKEFCHLLEKNDKDKAIRKMELFAKAVEITVETATDEPQTDCSWE